MASNVRKTRNRIKKELGETFYTHSEYFLPGFNITLHVSYDLSGLYFAEAFKGNTELKDIITTRGYKEALLFEVKSYKDLVHNLFAISNRNLEDIINKYNCG